MIPKEVLEAFDNLCYPEKSLVWVATCSGGKPHLVPVCFVKALGDDRLLIGNVFIKQTERNIKANSRIAVGVAFKREGWDGYMLKGEAEILKEGEPFESFKKEVFERTKGKRKLASALLVSVAEVYSLAPRRGRKREV